MEEGTKQTAVATKDDVQGAEIQMTKGMVQIRSIDDAYRVALYVSKSGFAPKGLERPESILIAMQHGAEIGLAPMQSLQSIAIINGRPGIYGDAALALVRASGLLDSYEQGYTGAPGRDDYTAVVTTVRKGGSKITTPFSVADAKAAGLWDKQGPWKQYPARMLLFRARGFNLRDNFGDILKGLRTAEELYDTPQDVTDAVTVHPAASDAAPAQPPPNSGADNLASRLKSNAADPAQPAGPVEPVRPEGGIAEGKIEDIKEKAVKIDGKDAVRYGIVIGGEVFGTLDEAVKKDAETFRFQDATVKLAWIQNGKLRDAVNILIAE